jgi:NTE family protein
MSHHEMTNTAADRPHIGLALSGGGVRGLAHLGVLRVLEEAEIPIDLLTGASMGGLVAAIYAAGVPLDEIITFAIRLRLLDLASPDHSWRGFFDHRKMTELLTRILGCDTLTFEDLTIPVAVTAADLITGELVILDSGPLIPALLATSALPIFFAPVQHQGRWLIDGGVLNNAPFDIARHRGADRVLAVIFPRTTRLDLTPKVPPASQGLSLRMLKQLRGQGQWRQPFLIAEAGIWMLQELVNERRADLCPPDVVLEIPLPEIGMLSIDAGREAIAAGYDVAQRNLDELRSLTAPLPAPWVRKAQRFQDRLARAWHIVRGDDAPLYPAA